MRLLAPCAALWLWAATPGLVHADDYVIDDDQTTQNAGFTIDGDDTLTITPEGSVAVATDWVHGVYAEGDDNTIVNNGAISAHGFYGDGIRVNGVDNVVINYGTITATGEQGDGMQSNGGANKFYNHGTIRVSGNWSDGIHLSDGVGYAENTGLIIATGANSMGIGAWDAIGVTVRNSGTIKAFGDEWLSFGVAFTGGATTGGNTFINSGTVRSAQSHAIGFWGPDNTVINSGTLRSPLFAAICFDDYTGNVLILQNGTFLEGHLILGFGTTVNLDMTGPTHSIRWKYEGTYEDDSTVANPRQFFHDPEHGILAFYDHTALAGTLDQLGDTQTLLSALGAHGARQKGPHLWAASTVAGFTHDGDEVTFERDIEIGAFAAGYNHTLSDTMTVGIMMAYLWGEQDGNSWLRPTYTIESTGFFAGARASIDLGMLDVELGATIGRIDYEHERFINDTEAAGGESWASSDYDGMYYSVDATVSGRIPVATVTLKPTLGAIYSVHHIDEHTESGAADNATIGDRELALLTVKAGMAVEKKLFNVVTAHVNGGYLARTNQGDQSAQVTLRGQTKSLDYGEADKDGVYFGGGVAIDLGASANLSASVVSYNGDGYNGLQAFAKISVGF